MNKIYLLVICLSMSLIIAPGQLAAAEKKTDGAKQTGSAKAGPKDYQIGAGDILEITIWKEPDLSREAVLVRTDGKISFPLLNDVQAAGLTPLEMKKNMEAGLKDFISNPFVTITVQSPESQKIYILGEVANTGEYPLTKNLTVLQAFALAGGFTEWASKKEIILMRKEGGKEKIYRVNYKNIIKGKDLGQNLKLKADDTIIVP
ncbi:MAG: polysaccharide biosynthesis/export family protein [Desulfobacteraceae bacterium]|nr:polysaccharide biosynthesis/export family protein [Desulfobacteraceae bacterium]